MKPVRPNLSLFKQFVGSSDLLVLRQMLRIINSRISVLQEPIYSETVPPNEFRTTKASLALNDLWQEDWSDLFGDCDKKREDFYVYLHADPSLRQLKFSSDKWSLKTRIPFYVGMGCGDRIFSRMRSRMHAKRINEIIKKGYSPATFMEYYKKGLSELEAREMESKLILFFGIRTAFSSSGGKNNARMLSGMRPVLLNQQYEPFPEKYDEYAYNGLSKARILSLSEAAHIN